MKKKTANKRLWLGMLVLALVFGMAAIGCNDGNGGNGGGGTIYDPTGTWTVTVQGQTINLTITASNTWTSSGYLNDSGTFSRNGNVGTLRSNTLNANIGTATMTSNTTMTLKLVSPSTITGTFNATKQ
jgi:hypothetical protein